MKKRPCISLRRRYGVLMCVCLPALFVMQANAPENKPMAAPTPPETQLSADLLAPVKHRTMGIRAEESDSYYSALRQARDVDYRKQQQAATEILRIRKQELPKHRDSDAPFPLFVDLFKHPDRYHGRPVSFQGSVRKITPFRADANKFEIESLYEAWIYTEDSQSNPIVVVTTQIPTDIPRGDHITERVAVTGFFFKLYGYNAQDTTRLAPLLLAQQLEWFPEQQPDNRRTVPILLSIGFSLVLVLIIWSLWRSARGDRALSRKRLAMESAEQPAGDLSRLNVIDDDVTTAPPSESESAAEKD